MITQARQEILECVARHILNLNFDHPVRVGIDGVAASGKSTFARELAQVLQRSNRNITQTTLDGFHNPRTHRYGRGRGSPEGYYYDATTILG